MNTNESCVQGDYYEASELNVFTNIGSVAMTFEKNNDFLKTPIQLSRMEEIILRDKQAVNMFINVMHVGGIGLGCYGFTSSL